MSYLTDIEIAQRCEKRRINEVAALAGIEERYLENYGSYKAKVDLGLLRDLGFEFVISPFGKNLINISARSLERINVQLIMEKLGGGGHHSMAAAQLKDMTAEEAFAVLKEKIDEYLLQTKE